MCTATNDMRLGEIFNESHMGTLSRSCSVGGCAPEVVVEFRPNKSAYGTFGFDWLRVEDTDLGISKSDVKYTKNVGNHYKKRYRGGKAVVDALGRFLDDGICTSDAEITPGDTIFKLSRRSQNNLAGTFPTLAPLNIRNIPSLQRGFQYKMPVITLMPNDLHKNPSNINRIAVLDVMVYMGKRKANNLRLKFSDARAAARAFKFNTINIPNSTKKAHLTITSIGTLYNDLVVSVYTDTGHVCGAFKILRNNGVKDIKVIYIGTRVNAKPPHKEKVKQPPTIDEALLRSKLAQALVNIKEIKRTDARGNPLLLNMLGKLHWISASTPGGTKFGLDFDNIIEQLDRTYQRTYGLFPANTFRCYFLADQAVSRHWHLVADGGGTPGMPRSMFFGDGGKRISTLAHELGHNLNLKHTFTQGAQYVYKYLSTDNIMDYSGSDSTFYHWQWKEMNPGGFS